MAGLGLALAGLLAITSSAQAAQKIITSAGPLTNIYLNDNLGCQLDHVGDTHGEFFSGTNPGSCGTFVFVGTTLYGPPVTNVTPYTPVSQSAVTGSGTAADPFKVITVVDVGATGLRLTQTDSYVVGDEFYRTDIQVSNSSGSTVTGALYHAGDCYLQGSDSGFGFHDSGTGGIFCSATVNNSPPARVVGFIPATPGSHYDEAAYFTNYARIDGTQYPDTCDCTTFEDNGAGLSWPLSVPAGGLSTFTLSSAASPTGVIPNPTPPPPPPPPPPPLLTTPAPVTPVTAAKPAPKISVSGVASSGCRTANFRAHVSISDALKLSGVDIFLDGRRIVHTHSKRVGVRVLAKALASGTHTIKIAATNSAGRSSTRIVHFTRCAQRRRPTPPRFTG